MLISFLTLLLIQCKDKNNDKPPVDLGHFSLDSTVAPYLYFKSGSWWVYKNDSTGEIDSQVMNWSDYRLINAISEKRKYSYNDIVTVIKSASNGYYYDVSSMGLAADSYNWKYSMRWTRSRHKSGDYDGINSVFLYPLDSTFDFGSASEESHFRGLIPKMDLNGFTFYDVLKFEVKGDASWPDSEMITTDNGISTYYWAKGIGLIKVSNDDFDMRYNPPIRKTQSWEIINYKIIK